MSDGSTSGLRKSQESNSGEYIAEDARRWDAETFIPVTVAALKEALLDREQTPQRRTELHHVFEAFTSVMNHQYRSLHQLMETHYAVLDPDRDLLLLADPNDMQREDSLRTMGEHLDALLRAANFTQLDHDMVVKATQGASEWGVRLNVNFDLFEEINVYARGDVVGVRTRRMWQRFWQLTEISVPVYQRLVIVFKLKQDAVLPTIQAATHYAHDRLHLSMFKNIPKSDVDMLMPCSVIRFSWLDRTKIFAPTLGGIGVTLFKLFRGAVVIAATGLAAVMGVTVLVIGVVGYVIRSVFSYFRTKDKYLLNMTQSLYFQKLDSNAGVIFRLLQEARQQDLLELIVAYCYLANADGPRKQARMQRGCERLLKELLQIDLDFDATAAIKRLRILGLFDDNDTNDEISDATNSDSENDNDQYSVLQPAAAYRQLNIYWDNVSIIDRSSP